jgi:hypothetical protein
MSFGCHQEPCRCAEPCTCQHPFTDDLAAVRACPRHNDDGDQRHPIYEPGPDDFDEVTDQFGSCPECGERGACAYDDEGRPLIHLGTGDDE